MHFINNDKDLNLKTPMEILLWLHSMGVPFQAIRYCARVIEVTKYSVTVKDFDEKEIWKLNRVKLREVA